MSKQSLEDNSITVDLREFIYCILGDDQDGLMCRPIHPNVALILAHKVNQTQKWHVEFDDREGNPKEFPVLWRWSEWKTDSETYARRKKCSEEDRVNRFIKEANMRKFVKSIMKSHSLTEGQARRIAHNLLSKDADMSVLSFFGIDKKITTIEEV